ncbi:MAG: hypothetical protein J6O62_00835 [Bacilli bacterium]|nr:hypothetical protein [Bacilli bacterium]
MKNKNVIYISSIIILLVLLLVLATIYKNPSNIISNPIIGRWSYKTENSIDYGVNYTFDANGKGTYSYKGNESKFTYKVGDSKLIIKYDNDEAINNVNYKIKDNILTIEDNEGNKISYQKN